MSKLDGIKSMPYRIGDRDLEIIKIRSSAAIIEAVSKKRSKAKITRWIVSTAAAVVLFVGVAIGIQSFQSECDQFIEQLADVPESILYDMSVDAVEYSDDMYIL